jgi:hypothetical protein
MKRAKLRIECFKKELENKKYDENRHRVQMKKIEHEHVRQLQSSEI